jgi:hypothetical protein
MTKFLPYIFIAILFFSPRPSLGQTYIVPIDDILMEIPYFTNAPDFNLNNGLQGSLPVGNSTKQPRNKVSEQEILDLAWSLYPNAENIRIWNKKLIIKFKD